VSTSKEIRKAAEEFQKTMGDWTSGIFMRDDLYKVLEQYKVESDKDGSYEKLDPESKRYVNSTLTGMEETGTKLNAAHKKRYLAV